MASNDSEAMDTLFGNLFGRMSRKGKPEQSTPETAPTITEEVMEGVTAEVKLPRVRIKLSNRQYCKLLKGETLEYKVGGHQVLLVLPADVRDVVQQTYVPA